MVEWKSSEEQNEVLTKTVFLVLEGDTERDIVLPSGKVSSILEIGENTRDIVVGGLEEEVEELSRESGGKDVAVTMSIKEKETDGSDGIPLS